LITKFYFIPFWYAAEHTEAIVIGIRWLIPIILATQGAEIRRISVQSQPRQIVCETLSQKNPSQKRVGGVVRGVGPEFKPQ
jgi:hypothetical protein